MLLQKELSIQQKDIGISIPVVVRLEGTNVEAGKELLNKSKLNIISADNLIEAAQIAVKLSKE